jgi:hypothetical protein
LGLRSVPFCLLIFGIGASLLSHALSRLGLSGLLCWSLGLVARVLVSPTLAPVFSEFFTLLARLFA